MRELTIQDIETIIRSDENRIVEVKKTTGEIDAGMSSGCAFLNTDGGWLLFGIAPKSLMILGQDVTDPTKQEIAPPPQVRPTHQSLRPVCRRTRE